MRAEQTDGRQPMTWSSVDWAATEAAVGRIQDRIFRAAKMTKRRRLEPYETRVCAVKNGGSNPCRRQEKLEEMLLGQPSYLMAKVYGDKSMTVKRGFGRTCQTQCPARPARYG